MTGSLKSVFKSRRKTSVSAPDGTKPLMRVLEPRILLDAAAVETALDIAGQAAHSQLADDFIANSKMADEAGANGDGENDEMSLDRPLSESDADETDASLARSSERQVVFIDAAVDDKETLIASLEPGVTVHILDGNRDGIQQMVDLLADADDYDAIHIFSHGTNGALQLGNATLDSGSMSSIHAQALRTIGASLSESGDILIYGCNFGQGDTGRHAAGLLASLTGADIAASDDLTGAESLAGDWDLELKVGTVERQAYSLPDWEGILDGYQLAAVDAPTLGHVAGGVAGTPGSFATWSDAVSFDPGNGDPIEYFDLRATVTGISGAASATFETVASGDGSLDDFRVVITNIGPVVDNIDGEDVLEAGSVTVVWDIFISGTETPAPAEAINIVLSDLDGLAGTADTRDSISIEPDELWSYTVEEGTELVDDFVDGGLKLSGTQQGTNNPLAQVGAFWANASQFAITYTSHTQTNNFDMDGDGGKTFTNPDVRATQSIDLNGADAGQDYIAVYINNASQSSSQDVPVSLVSPDMFIFDLDSLNLESATITLTNKQSGDVLNFDPVLLDRLGITADLTDTGTELVLSLTGFSMVTNYETAIKSITYENTTSDALFVPGPARVVTFEVTDGLISTTGRRTQVFLGAAGEAPIAGTNVYVEDEDTLLFVTQDNGLLSDDLDPQDNPITVTAAYETDGTPIPVGVGHVTGTGAMITINADGSFSYMPSLHYSGNETIVYEITDSEGNTSQSSATIDIQPVVDAVTMLVTQDSPVSLEDSPSAPISIDVSSPDDTETQVLLAEAIPFGVILTDGTNSFRSSEEGDTVEITRWDRGQLRVLPVQNSDAEINISFTALNFEIDGSESFESTVVTFQVDAVADVPLLVVEDAFGGVDEDIPLFETIQPQLFDTDSSEQITDITINGVPPGGRFFADGIELTVTDNAVSFLLEDLPNLIFRPPQIGADATYDMLVSVTVEELFPNGNVAVDTATRSDVGLRVRLTDTDSLIVAVDDDAVTFAGEAASIDVLANDLVPDGGPTVIEINGEFIDLANPVDLPGGEGSVSLGLSGSLVFTASETFSGEVTFSYTVQDADGSTDQADVTVEVQPRWRLTSDTAVDEGDSARFTVTVEGAIPAGETVGVELTLNDVSTDPFDYGSMQSAINTAIANDPDSGFAYDGTTLTYTGPPLNYSPAYDAVGSTFTDISATGTALNLGDDGLAGETLGFYFPFYGANYDTVYVSTNGYVTFGSPVSAPDNLNLDGSALAGRPIIAPFWDDLDTAPVGNVYVERIDGPPGDNEYIIQWDRVTNATDGLGPASFQIILSEATGNIRFNYDDVSFDGTGDDANGATIGVQGAGLADEYSFNQAGSITSGSSILYTQNLNLNPSLVFDLAIVDDTEFEDNETFNIQLSNSTGSAIGQDQAIVTINVSDNEAPDAQDDFIEITEVTSAGINVITNSFGVDTDPEGHALFLASINGQTITSGLVVNLPSGASMLTDTNGFVSYNPRTAFNYLKPGEQGFDSFSYVVRDEFGAETTATVFVTIDGVNQTARFDLNDDGVSFERDIDVVYQAADTEIAVAAPNAIVSDPDNDTFDTIEISLDGFVQPVDEILRFNGVAFPYGTASLQTTTIDTTTFSVDYDGADLVTITLSGGGKMPVAQIETLLRGITYENASSDDERGFRTLTFRIDDGSGFGPDADSVINVRGNNIAPTAVDDGVGTPFETAEDTAILIFGATLLSNDSDAEGDDISIESVSGGANGSAVLLDNGNVIFTPSDDFVGATSFTYTLVDAFGGTNVASVFVDVTPVNDAPRIDLSGIGGGFSQTYVEDDPLLPIADPAGTLVDVDNSVLTSMRVVMTGGQVGDRIDIGTVPPGILASITPSNAQTGLTSAQTVTLQFTGTATVEDYQTLLRQISFEHLSDTPVEGDRVFTVTASDGIESSTDAISTITVQELNDAPAIGDDGPFNLDEDTFIGFTKAQLMVNDSDVEGDAFDIVSVGNATNGTVSITPSDEIVFVPDADYSGPASFTYTVEDSRGDTAIGLVTLNVVSVNDVTTIDLDTNVSGTGFVTSYVEDGPGLSIVDASISIGDVDDTELESATIALTNGQIGDVLEATGLPIGISAVVVPSGPLTAAGTQTLTLDGPATLEDFELALQAVTYRSTSQAPSEVQRSISITVNDGDDDSLAAIALVNVEATNDAPIAVDDAPAAFDEDTARTFTVAELTANDFDPDIEPFTFVSVDNAVNGTVVFNAPDEIVFTPDADYFGPASFTYTIEDGTGTPGTGTVNLTITAVNDAPQIDLDAVAIGTGFSVDYEENQTGVSLVNSDIEITDVDNASFASATFTLTNGYVGDVLEVGALPAGFSFSTIPAGALVADGAVVATLDGPGTLADFRTAMQAVTYRSVSERPSLDPRLVAIQLSDGQTLSNIAMTTIAVTGVNDDPVAVTDGPFGVDEDNDLVLSTTALFINDSDPDLDIPTLVSVQDAVNGSVLINVDGDVVFTPDADYFGPASFTYTIEDGNGGEATALVNINVNPVNDAPVLEIDQNVGAGTYATAYTENATGIAIVDVTAIIDDVDNTDLTGATIVLDNGRIGDTLEIGALPLGVTADFSPGGSLITDGPLTLSISGTASRAEYAQILQSVTYRSLSDDLDETERTIRIQVTDGSDGSNMAITSIAMTAVNDAPTAVADGVFAFDEDTTFTLFTGALTFNDSDPENDTLTVISVQDAVNGTVGLDAGQVTFTPTADYSGPASFTYTVSDGNGGESTQTVTLTVNAVNDVPLLDTNTTLAGDGNAVDYTENALGIAVVDSSVVISDVDNLEMTSATVVLTNGKIGDVLEVGSLPGTISAVISPSGPLVADGNQTVTLTGTGDYDAWQTALASVTFRSISDNPDTVERQIFVRVSDGAAQSAISLTQLSFEAVNDAPTAGADGVFAFDEDQVFTLFTGSLTFNDTDPEGDDLTILSVQDPVNGTVAFGAPGQILFTPDMDYSGPASFTYTVSDGNGGESTQTVSLTVNAVNDAPFLDANTGVIGEGHVDDYTENEPGIPVVDASVFISDVDNTDLASATIALTNGKVGDILEVGSLPPGITASVSPSGPLAADGNQTLTLSGTGVLSAWQTALASVTYRSVSDNPNTDDRQIFIQVSDGETSSNIALTQFTFTAVNDAPIANADGVFAFDEDTDFAILPAGLLFNDTDAEGDSLFISSVQDPVNGSVIIDGDGRIVFTPDVNYSGPASFTYTVDDGNGDEATTTVNLLVNAVNDVPTLDLSTGDGGTGFTTDYEENQAGVVFVDPTVLIDDVESTSLEGATITLTNGRAGDVLDIDTLPFGISAAPSATMPLLADGSVSVTLSGTATIEDYQLALQAITYRSTSDDIVTDPRTIEVTVDDGEDLSEIALATINVTAVNDAPTLQDDGPFTFAEDTVLNLTPVSLLFNDTDAENDDLSIVSVQDAVNGSVAIDGDGRIVFTPDEHYNGAASFTYTVSDGNGGTATAAASLTVTSVNDIPVVDLNAGAAGEGHIATYTEGGDPVVLIDASGFVLDADHDDLVEASFTLNNGRAGDQLQVGGLPAGISAVVLPETPLTDNGTITVTLSGAASKADYRTALEQVTFSSTSLNMSGVTRDVTIVVSDGVDQSEPVTALIVVNIINDAPVTTPDGVFAIDEDVPLQLTAESLLVNDTDPEGDALRVVQVLNPVNGTVSMDGDGLITFTPDLAYFGPASFEYVAEDANGAQTTEVVNIEVNFLNDAPILDLDTVAAGNDFTTSYTENGSAISIVGADIALSDEDHLNLLNGTVTLTNGQIGDVVEFGIMPGSLTVDVSPAGALTSAGPVEVTLSGNAPIADYVAALNSITFRSVSDNPDASDRIFEFTLFDGFDPSLVARTTIEFNAVNDAPVANDDGVPLALELTEDTPITFNPVLTNDSDVENDALTITAIDGSAIVPGGSVVLVSGTVALDDDGSTLTFTPTPNSTGFVSFSYEVSDGELSDTAQIFLNIIPVNDTPVAVDDGPVVLVEDGDVFFDPVTASDSDVENDPLAIVAIDGVAIVPNATVPVASGSISLGADGRTLHYVPARDYNGLTPVSYTISDGNTEATAVITFDVTPVEDTITVISTPDDMVLSDGDVINIPLAGHFDDPDGDMLTFTMTGQPAGLEIGLNTGIVTGVVDPSASQTGPYTVTIRADDGFTLPAEFTFMIDVNNTVPVASGDQTISLGEGSSFMIDGAAMFTDADGDVLSYALSGQPGWVNFDAGSGMLSGTVPTDAAGFGPSTLTLTADDSEGGTAFVVLTLEPRNEAPVVIAPVNDMTVQDGDAINIDVTTLFADGGDDTDTLAYSVTGLPAGVTFDVATGLISGSVGASAPLNSVVRITADDGQGGVTVEQFTIIKGGGEVIETPNIFAAFEDLVTLDEEDTNEFDDGELRAILNTFENLNGTSDLGSDSEVVANAVSSIDPLNGTAGADAGSGGGVIGDGPSQIDGTGNITGGEQGWSGSNVSSFISPSGDPVERAVGAPDDRLEKLSVKTTRGPDTVVISFRHTLDPMVDGVVSQSGFTLPNGKPLPEWMRALRKDFLSITPPVDTAAAEILLTVVMENGDKLERLFNIDLEAGTATAVEAPEVEVPVVEKSDGKSVEKLPGEQHPQFELGALRGSNQQTEPVN
ncbi:MAG: tandem-95 repeat protein [Pseudomonadota bacterium]